MGAAPARVRRVSRDAAFVPAAPVVQKVRGGLETVSLCSPGFSSDEVCDAAACEHGRGNQTGRGTDNSTDCRTRTDSNRADK